MKTGRMFQLATRSDRLLLWLLRENAGDVVCRDMLRKIVLKTATIIIPEMVATITPESSKTRAVAVAKMVIRLKIVVMILRTPASVLLG
jgi:hypothetical protein